MHSFKENRLKKAYWKSKDFRSLKELKGLELFKESSDERGWSLKHRWYPLDFWKFVREAVPTQNPNKCKSCEYLEE